jgi:hypothetical protein
MLWLAVLAALSYFSFSDAPIDVRFTTPWPNHLAFLIFWFGFPCVVVSVGLWHDWPTASSAGRVGRSIVFTLFLAVMSVGVLLVLAFDFQEGEVVQTVKAGRYRLVLERMNCGATCSFDLRLRQEWFLAPGIMASRGLGYWSYASEGHVAIVDQGAQADSVRVQIEAGHRRRRVPVDTILAVYPSMHSRWSRLP